MKNKINNDTLKRNLLEEKNGSNIKLNRAQYVWILAEREKKKIYMKI